MMTLQYLSDNKGHTTAVQLQIPIEEWNRLKEQYPEFGSESSISQEDLPEWQKELGILELNLLASDKAETARWEDIKGSFRF